jgi:hypothetical protein
MAGSVILEGRTSANAPALSIGGKFDKFRPEEEKASKKAEVKESEAVQQIKDAWGSFSFNANILIENYKPIQQIVKNLQYEARDVEEFSVLLAEFQDEKYFSWKAGLFLSALINCGKDSDYIIHTQHLVRLPTFLGYRNEKNIIVNGNAGGNVGEGMKTGSITINGNVGTYIGTGMKGGSITVEGNVETFGWEMQNGSILVKGDAGDYVGQGMRGGQITVNGNVGSEVGLHMVGGEIWLGSDFGNLSDKLRRGKIYYKRDLIFER